MRINPLADQVLVKPTGVRQKTLGGIYLPDTSKEKSIDGIAEEVGPGKTLANGSISPLGINKGDRVIFRPGSGVEIEVDGNKFRMIPSTDILGTIEG